MSILKEATHTCHGKFYKLDGKKLYVLVENEWKEYSIYVAGDVSNKAFAFVPYTHDGSKCDNPINDLIIDENTNWVYISEFEKLSEDFIEKHSYKVYWPNIAIYQRLSEEFIEKHSDRVDWIFVSAYQKLSEEFIEKRSDKVDWNSIVVHQKLSQEFIEKHIDRMHMLYITLYQNVDIEKFPGSVVLKSVFYCGSANRCIRVLREDPSLIHLGCFKGTKEKAIKAINKKYSGQEALDYISKVNECFDF